MKETKAEKVLHGDKNYEIVYKNQKVWLESIDEKSGVASVSVIDTGEKMKIPVSELEGKGFEFK